MKAIKSHSPTGATVTLETGEIARQADGAVLVSMDDTVVLVTCVARAEAKEGQDFPLTVDYQEKTFAPPARFPAVFSSAKAAPGERPDLPPDRPSVAPAVPGWFLQRSADHCHRAFPAIRRSIPTFRP